jgi:hypothetical protein
VDYCTGILYGENVIKHFLDKHENAKRFLEFLDDELQTAVFSIYIVLCSPASNRSPVESPSFYGSHNNFSKQHHRLEI